MKAARIITIVLGVLMIVTGVYCLFTPAMTYLSLGYIVAFNMVLDAIGGIATWSERKGKGMADGWTLAGAIASLVFRIVLRNSLIATRSESKRLFERIAISNGRWPVVLPELSPEELQSLSGRIRRFSR